MINIVVVDDSAFMIHVITTVMSETKDIRVIGSARSGEEGVTKVRELKPDCVTMDINMPGMGGVEAVHQIMSTSPVPVVLLSAHSEEGAEVTMKALEYGAVDFIQKPNGEISIDLGTVKDDLLRKIRTAVTAKVKKLRPEPPRSVMVSAPPVGRTHPAKVILAIGVSTGGPRLLKELISLFPPDLRAGILISQHLPADYTAKLVESIAGATRLGALEAGDLTPIMEGVIHVCPGGYDMTVRNGKIFLKRPMPDALNTPSVDVMFESVAAEYKNHCAGIILTGMGSDGTLGARKIKDNGGYIIAQDESTSTVFGMPRSVIEAGLADEVVAARMVPHRALHWVNTCLEKIGA